MHLGTPRNVTPSYLCSACKTYSASSVASISGYCFMCRRTNGPISATPGSPSQLHLVDSSVPSSVDQGVSCVPAPPDSAPVELLGGIFSVLSEGNCLLSSEFEDVVGHNTMGERMPEGGAIFLTPDQSNGAEPEADFFDCVVTASVTSVVGAAIYSPRQ